MFIISSNNIKINISLAQQYVAAMNDHNLDRIDEIFHPDFQITQQIVTPSLRYNRMNAGIDEVKNILQGYLTAFPDIHLTIIDTLGSENSAIVYWMAKVTHEGDFFGLKATNKKIELEGFYYFKMKEGKIIDYNLTFDTLKLFTSIGHSIIEEGDDHTISEYLKLILDLDLEKLKKM